MKNIFIIVLNVMLVACLYLMPPAHAGKNVKFSSVYTDLKTQCRSALTKQQEREAERIGEDIPAVCKGYGGYEISLASHGTMTQFEVRIKSGNEFRSVVQETLFISDPIYTRKVEWRLADGVPFAVIFRRDINDEPEDPAMKKKIGEMLRVIGLKDDRIDFKVDVKNNPNPNEEARRLADNAYAGGR